MEYSVSLIGYHNMYGKPIYEQEIYLSSEAYMAYEYFCRLKSSQAKNLLAVHQDINFILVQYKETIVDKHHKEITYTEETEPICIN